jgi:hypothetical protein
MKKKEIQALQDRITFLEDDVKRERRIREEYGDSLEANWRGRDHLAGVVDGIVNKISALSSMTGALQENTYLNGKREVAPMLAGIAELVKSELTLELTRIKIKLDVVRGEHNAKFMEEIKNKN